ncbi:MAG: hypothetical protein JW713_15460, partial [Pontiellaceae bacterium]|nr:hypothetical protein [Pontiellaceae bacterium]
KRLETLRAGGYVMDAGGDKTPSGSDKVGEETFINYTYLQLPQNFEKMKALIQRFKAERRPVWIYDEYAYPSGSAGGLTFADGHDDCAAQVVSFRQLSAGTTIELKPGAEVLACVALPMNEGVADLSNAKDLTKPVRTGAPVPELDSGWVICLLERYAADTWKHHNMGRRNLNVMDRAAVQRFMEVTHYAYAKQLGPVLNDVDAFFTDEPQFSSAEFWGRSGRAEADPMVQWTDELIPAFKESKGYDLVPMMPALFMDVGPETARYRYDFYDVHSDLMAQNYFGQIGDWCHSYGIQSTGHLLLEESLLFHVMFSGSAFKNWALQDLPGMDLLGARAYRSMPFIWEPKTMPIREDLSCKMVSSVAHVQGKPGVFSESFATANKATLRDVLGAAGWQYSEGITHLVTYTIQGTLPAEEYARFCDYSSRLALFARRGKPVSRVAVLVPESSVWSVYNPPGGGGFDRYFSDNPEAVSVETGFRRTCETLLSNQIQFECVSEALLAEASVEKNQLHVGVMNFDLLVVPEARFMPTAVMAKVQDFIASGGRVSFVGALPQQSDRSGAVADIVKLLVKQSSKVRHDDELPLAWIEKTVNAPTRWDGDSAVRMQIKQDDGEQVVILSNPSAEPVRGRLKVRSRGTLTLWDPETGEHRILKGRDSIIELNPQSACIVTLAD